MALWDKYWWEVKPFVWYDMATAEYLWHHGVIDCEMYLDYAFATCWRD